MLSGTDHAGNLRISDPKFPSHPEPVRKFREDLEQKVMILPRVKSAVIIAEGLSILYSVRLWRTRMYPRIDDMYVITIKNTSDP